MESTIGVFGEEVLLWICTLRQSPRRPPADHLHRQANLLLNELKQSREASMLPVQAVDDAMFAIAAVLDEIAMSLPDLRPTWAAAPEYASVAARVRHVETLHEHVAAWTRAFDDRELAARLQRHGVAAAPVLSVADLLADPHYRARGTFIEVRHPLGFDETIYGAYVKTSRTEAAVRTGPRIGQDNERVFKEILGLPAERYERLVAEQVIY